MIIAAITCSQMTDEKDTDNQSLFDKLVGALLRRPWADVLGDALKALRKAIQGRSHRGLYEVLDYESTLELKDCEGKTATFRKREKVRYLQDNVIAYQDQAWGDGEILLNYRCTPGTPVDRYRSGYKTTILISRREVKDKGDVDEATSNGAAIRASCGRRSSGRRTSRTARSTSRSTWFSPDPGLRGTSS
jgi:hypothetical protein